MTLNPKTPTSVQPEPIQAGLSKAARSAWAKHDRRSDGWMPLWRHLADSSAVAAELWDSWLPESVRGLLAEALPGGEADARRLVCFVAATHDVGKCSPAFACQVDSLADRMRQRGLDMLTARQYGQERTLAPHGLAGQILLQEWLQERFGLGARVTGQLAVVAGGHHGVPPESGRIHDVQLRPHLLRHPGPGEEVWRTAQFELLDWCADFTGVAPLLSSWSEVRLSQPAQVLLTAVVIMADWIASAPELFPYAPESWQPAGPVGENRRLRAAWAGLDLAEPWRPEVSTQSPQELFAERFPHLGTTPLRPVQAAAIGLARQMAPAGLLIIEAPMGDGKTEAALISAEILAARSGAGGLLLALPTRATGDAMFRRLLSWLEALPKDGARSWSVVLAHAKAALQSEWAGLLRSGSRAISAVDPDGDETRESEKAAMGGGPGGWHSSGLHAHQWLRGRKKQLLASFAVGTVDQVLFSALKTRHLALRHLAVAGKVVVIDEVHAYDAYMNRYLDRTLEWLAAYRVPVVLLSATLPAERRLALAAAYAGEGGAAGVETEADAYPLLTAVSPGRKALGVRPAPAQGRGVEVVVERLDDDLASLVDRLDVELAEGGCALVVRNTVARVLEAAEALRERFGSGQVTVAHSRFLAADRAVNDARLVERYGPGGDRPERHVVVASQVVEQSLDVSFDLLVTDLAPVDLVLQRMGRLHRHPQSRPERLTVPRCLITGVSDWGAAPPVPVKGSRAVYRGEWTLLRALAVLRPHLDGEPLRLPQDISPLVQSAYGKGTPEPDAWGGAMAKAGERHDVLLKTKRRRADGFLLGPVRRPGRPVYGWLAAHAGDADDSRQGRAQVRDAEETLEVLVVRRTGDGRLTTVPWLDGGRGGLELPTDFPPNRRAAEAVAASSLTLPGRFSHPGVIDRTVAELERFLVPAWQVKECPWLAGELFLVLDNDCRTHLSGCELTYSQMEGLRFAVLGVPAVGGGSVEDKSDNAAADMGQQPAAGPAQVPGGQPSGNIARKTEGDEDAVPCGPPAFNLVRDPWLPVQRIEDGTVVELSLRDVFAQAGRLRRLVGDIPTQEFALLRLALAVLYDAFGGPEDLDAWAELWEAEDPFAKAVEYLDQHAGRFELFDADRPFFQAPGLRTDKDEVAPLSRIVADVPTGSALFSMRRPGVERLPFAEAARWLVHAHAFDVSGIKSAMRGDGRGKAGKVYPLGVGSLGLLGGVFAEGDSLRETLLLNLVPFEDAYRGSSDADGVENDVPVWRRQKPYGPGRRDAAGDGVEPAGLRDLYTWQTRRIRLVAAGDAVTGVVLGYGDPLVQESPWLLEPMTAWRRSPVQEKKRKRPLFYTPHRHNARRSAWRGLEALLPARGGGADSGRGGEAAGKLPPRITQWLADAATECEFPPGRLMRLRTVGMEYGTQQSVIDEVIDDSVVLPVVTLHSDNPFYWSAAVDAVNEADGAVKALGRLAANLTLAAGGEHPEAADETARDLGYGSLDGPYRAWLRELAQQPDLARARQQWRETVRRHVRRLARQEVGSAGTAAVEGRTVTLPGLGETHVDAGRAELWFAARLEKLLGQPPAMRPKRRPGSSS